MAKRNPFLKQQYRSEMGIISNILGITIDAGVGGVFVSTLSRRANLSHYAVVEKCQKLIVAGLVESAKAKRNRLYKITEKGKQFFGELERFQDLIKEMNVRY